MNNKMKVNFLSISQNESFSRNVIASFVLELNPTVSELNDIKTAVSEAVTNALVHGYPDSVGEIEMQAEILENELHIKIIDSGVGIENLDMALEPYYSSKFEDERSGMGFTIMKAFMDEVKVSSNVNQGTVVYMLKRLSCIESK